VLTRSDRDRLSDLIMAPGAPSSTTEFLRQEIERAEIVAEEAVSSLVTIGTRVQFIDHNSHKISEGRLTLPNDVRANHSISILSPLGSALLGLGPGQSIDWIDDAGQDHRLTVVAIFPDRAEA
jgi:regulator of nucleoside diphosphate kinase